MDEHRRQQVYADWLRTWQQRMTRMMHYYEWQRLEWQRMESQHDAARRPRLMTPAPPPPPVLKK